VGSKDPARVRAYAEELLGDLSLALSFLRAQPGVDPDRIAYVGHSLGASIGGAFLAREPGVRAAVLMAGAGRLSRLWLQRRDPASSRALEDLDTETCLPRVHASLLFQFAAQDAWIARADADAQIGAAREPKRALWYACDHALDASAAADRARWLCQELGLPRVPELPPSELLPRAQVRACRVVAPFARVAGWLSQRG
jgi:dienelactone hydrolase